MTEKLAISDGRFIVREASTAHPLIIEDSVFFFFKLINYV